MVIYTIIAGIVGLALGAIVVGFFSEEKQPETGTRSARKSEEHRQGS